MGATSEVSKRQLGHSQLWVADTEADYDDGRVDAKEDCAECQKPDPAQSLPFTGERKSQCQLILAHFQAGGTLTVLEALEAPFRCYALSQRCGELRRDGHNVQGEWVDLPSKKRVKRYRLVT